MKTLDFSPKETLIIEDSEAGIEARKKADCKVVAIHDDRFKMNQEKADYIIKDLFQILEIIKANNGSHSVKFLV